MPCFRSLPLMLPSSQIPRHAPRSGARRGLRCTAKREEDAQNTVNFQQQARQAVLVAMLSIAAAIGLPFQAEAKRAEPPPPPPTAYDELQKIISGRSGNTGSLLESFKKTVTAPVSGLVESVQPSLPAAPQLAGSKASESKSGSPFQGFQGNAAVQEVQKGADQAVEGSPELGSSQPLLFAVAAAVLGFGGYKVFTGRQGEVASKPRSAAKGAKRQVQRQAGTRKIGGAAKQAAKKAPQPVKTAFQSTKAKSAGPSKKSSGGFLGIGRASSPKQAAKKVAPKATKKIQRSGTKKIGTQKAGTKRSGGTKAIGTRRSGAAQPASRRLQLDEDTSSTLGAAGVVGLGVAVAAFVAFNLTVDDSATAQEAVKEAVSKLSDVPAVIADAGKGQQNVIASAQTAAPEVSAPDAGAPVQEAKQKLQNGPNAVASVAEKASEGTAKAAPDPVAKVAEKAEGQGTPEKPAEVPAPDPLEPKTEPQAATGQIASAAKKDGPQAIAEVAKSPEAEAVISKTPEESLTKPAPAVQRSPDTTTLRKGAVEDASRQKASQTARQSGDQPKPSAAFEAATKKLSSGQSGAELFAKTRAEEQKKFEAESQKVADKVAGKQPQTASKKGAAPSPSKATQAAGKAAQSGGGGSSGLILGGLAAAAVVGIAVAAPKDKAAGAANEAASAAKDSATSAKESIESTGTSGNSSSSGGGDVKDDIANRKKDAQKWISDWRQETGGK